MDQEPRAAQGDTPAPPSLPRLAPRPADVSGGGGVAPPGATTPMAPSAAPVAPPPPPSAAAAAPSSPHAAPTPRPRSAPPAAVHTTLPNGVLVRKGTPPMLGSAAFGWVMVATYAAVSAVWVLIALDKTKAYHLFQDVVDRGRVREIDIRRATELDDRTIRYAVVLVGAYLVATVATALYTRRVAKNSLALGETSVSPGWATWCWFIPVVNLFAGFSQLRRAPKADWPVWSWQLCFLTPTVAAWLVSRMTFISSSYDATEYGQLRPETILSQTRNEWIATLFFAGLLPLATLLAARAVVVLHKVFGSVNEHLATAAA